jgi:hypothetical protein
MKSPAFSNFRELMDKWDAASRMFVENDLCLFFKKDGVIYGANETGRITFARMKNPESKEDKEWAKEASFAAFDLEKSTDAEKTMSVFHRDDIDDMKILTQDKVEKQLEKKGKKIIVVSDDGDGDKTYGEE